MSASPIAPAWAVLPVAGLTMVVIAAYVLAMASPLAAKMVPASRRRIRLASGWVSLVAVPVIAAGFSVVPPSQARAFVLVWSVGSGLLVLVLLLAMLDLADTWRMRRAEERRLAAELAAARRAARAASVLSERSVTSGGARPGGASQGALGQGGAGRGGADGR